MWASAVAEAEMAADPGADLRHAGIGVQMDLLVFDGAPEALDEDVVSPGPLAVHADPDFAGAQHLDEVGRGELAALDALLCVKRSLLVVG
jgi:hypothetical protein